MDKELKLKRWRLLLGKDSEEAFNNCIDDGYNIKLDDEELLMAEALDAIYDKSNHELENGKSAGRGYSAPKISRWLGDIRKVFNKDIVKVIQNDAIERKGMKELLLEPEVLSEMTPDINLACTLLTLKNQVPERSKESVRNYIEAIVDDINKRINNDVQKAVTAAVNKKNHVRRGTASSLDFNYTIRRNLKNYNKDLKTIIPENLYFFDHKNKSNGWNIILDIDQSGSMGESILYSTVVGCILAKMSSISTRVVAFDTNIVDLTEKYDDPVDMLFGIQLGGGTDIYKSVRYCEQYIEDPKKTILFLVSDLEEWGNHGALINKMRYLKESGVTVICLLAISDDGEPYYNKDLANKFAGFGIPSFACSPNLLPELLEKTLKGESIENIGRKSNI